MANTKKQQHSIGRRSQIAAASLLAACGVLVLAAGGCGTDQNRVIQVDSASFQSTVLDSTQPVLIDFYKDGCPICLPMEPALDQLSSEYEGRVKVCRFMIMTAYWTFPAYEIKKKYQIALVPTVVLFDKGQEVRRWAVNYAADAYRPALDKVAPAVAAAPIEE